MTAARKKCPLRVRLALVLGCVLFLASGEWKAFGSIGRLNEVISPAVPLQVSAEWAIRLEIGNGLICGNDPVNRHDALGLADCNSPGWNPWLDKMEAARETNPFGAMWWGFWGTIRGVGPAIKYTGAATQAGLAQARIEIAEQTSSGEYGVGTALLARSGLMMGDFSAGTTFAPVHPVDTAVGVATAPAVVPFRLGTSLGEFSLQPSLSKGIDIAENGLMLGAILEGGSALTNRAPAASSASSLGGWRVVGEISDVKGYASAFGEEIASNSVGQATLRQLRELPDGFTATLNFIDVPAGLKGLWSKELGLPHSLDIFALNNTGVRGSASTFIHESRHGIMSSRGTKQLTHAAEYMARAREYLFLNGKRPNAAARGSIRSEVQRLYPNLPAR
jgi:hypothetical protein